MGRDEGVRVDGCEGGWVGAQGFAPGAIRTAIVIRHDFENQIWQKALISGDFASHS